MSKEHSRIKKGKKRSTRAMTMQQLAALECGESAVFIRDFDPKKTAQVFSSLIHGYARQAINSATWNIETFHAITYQRRAIAGIIVTRIT